LFLLTSRIRRDTEILGIHIDELAIHLQKDANSLRPYLYDLIVSGAIAQVIDGDYYHPK
jgi:hypothetical protein